MGCGLFGLSVPQGLAEAEKGKTHTHLWRLCGQRKINVAAMTTIVTATGLQPFGPPLAAQAGRLRRALRQAQGTELVEVQPNAVSVECSDVV